MIRFTLKGLATRKLRTALTAIAIVLGVSLVTGTYILTDSIKSAFNGIFTEVYRGTDATVTGKSAFDLSSKGKEQQLRRATNEAFAQRLIKPHEIITSRHRGAKLLRGLLADAAPTVNEFEDAVLALLNDLPRPEVNQRQGVYVPDFRWPDRKLIVEADGAQFHGHILARANDKTRQAELEARGLRVVRVTWDQLTREPAKTRARLAEAIRRSAG